jgi:hypothetical protein
VARSSTSQARQVGASISSRTAWGPKRETARPKMSRYQRTVRGDSPSAAFASQNNSTARPISRSVDAPRTAIRVRFHLDGREHQMPVYLVWGYQMPMDRGRQMLAAYSYLHGRRPRGRPTHFGPVLHLMHSFLLGHELFLVRGCQQNLVRGAQISTGGKCSVFTRRRQPGGIRTPDHLIRSPLPVGASCESRFVRGRRARETTPSSIPG